MEEVTIDAMTDEVMRDVHEKGMVFNTAFARAAHRRQIFHGVDRHRYNYFFTEVRKSFSK